MDRLQQILDGIAGFVWGPWLLIPLLLLTGLWLTIKLRGIQFRTLGPALRLVGKGWGLVLEQGGVQRLDAVARGLSARRRRRA